MKNTKKIIAFASLITLFSIASVHATSLEALRQACLNAPSSRKATACAKWKQAKKEKAGDHTPSDTTAAALRAAERKCLNAPWSERVRACAEYTRLLQQMKK